MRLLAFTPIRVADEECERRQARYDRLAPKGIQVVLQNLGSGSTVPRALETADDIAASSLAIAECYSQVDPAQWDGFLPDCVLDPVEDGMIQSGTPVFGLGRLAAHHVAGLGLSMVAVARNQAIASELDRRFAQYRVVTGAPTMALGLGVDDISDDAAWGATVAERIASLDCDVVFNACSAVDVTAATTRPLLVDPTWIALQMLAAGSSAVGVGV